MDQTRRVVAKVEWHPGELCPRVGFIVTNLARSAERVVAFYNHRGTWEQYIKEGKGAIKWTRLSCRTFAANTVRLQLHARAYNLGNFMRTLAMPDPIKDWSLTSLKEKLIKIGAKVVSHGRYVTFQMAEVAVSWQMFADILSLIARLRAPPAPARPADEVRCDRPRRRRCVLMDASNEFRRREPTLLAIFAAKGPAAIEFRCGDAAMTEEFIPTEPGIWGMSARATHQDRIC